MTRKYRGGNLDPRCPNYEDGYPCPDCRQDDDSNWYHSSEVGDIMDIARGGYGNIDSILPITPKPRPNDGD
jgi:hypothetical protein